MKMTSKPLIQDLVKEAMATDAQRAKIAAEGARQMNLADDSTKEASASQEPETVSTDYAMKLASAVEYATPFIVKAAEVPPPPGVSHSAVGGSPPGPGGQGKGHHQPPSSAGLQAAVAGAATQMPNDHARAPGGPGTQTTAMSGGKGKVAAAIAKLEKTANPMSAVIPIAAHALPGMAGYHRGKAEAREGNPHEWTTGKAVGSVLFSPYGAYQVGKSLGSAKVEDEQSEKKHKKEAQAPSTLVDAFLQHKVAEDAINPAKISAGAAVAPDTSASGESGGAPVAGMPQGPRGLVGSNESATNYKKNQAYAPRKAELKAYFNEPALTSSTDTTLQQAFAHTGEAGTKLAGAEGQVKTAAARALLSKLAEQTAGKAG